MTFDEYITNPMGGSVMSNKQVYYNLYEGKWNNLLVRENGHISYVLYKMANKDNYFIHFKIPSEEIAEFYYDVVIKFIGDNKLKEEPTLKHYNIQVYSNDPAFIFTFAYAFHKRRMLVQELLPKMSKTALRSNPKVRNPRNEIGYVKDLFFAYLEMKNKDLFNKAHWANAITYTSTALLRDVEHADIKVQESQMRHAAAHKKDKTAKNREKNLEQGKSVPHLINTHNFETKAKKFVTNLGPVKFVNDIINKK